MPSIKRIIVGFVLMAIPVVGVSFVKKSDWGAVLATPLARQTGDPKAKVIILEYSDFQCPSCAAIQPTIQNFLDQYKGKIRFFYKYYPLTQIHKNAMAAAHAAECAARQNQFWPYEERLFATQPNWSGLTDATTSFMAIAEETHLDTGKFTGCLADPSAVKPIQQDAAEAKAREVSATPTFFVDGERLVGSMFASNGARAIEKALRR